MVAIVLVAGLGTACPTVIAQSKRAAIEKNQAAAEALFTNGVILKIQLEIPKAGRDSLRRDGRTYVPATLREGRAVYTNVMVRLRGSIGSLRNVDDKPGLTLKLNTTGKDGAYYGLKKFHLHNSVQDGTYLSEWLCSDLFRAADVPVARAAHALVELNGQRLGLYVLVEAINEDFLARYCQNARGNVYGQSGGADVTEPLERMEGVGEDTHQDLQALAAAAQEPDSARLGLRLQQVLDVDRFLSFMALEVMLCHWDGYTFAAHNYRVFHNLDTGKMTFVPHDMDQMMGDPNVPILPGVNGLVSQAILRNPETRARYRERFGVLFTNVFVAPVLTQRIDALVAKLLPTLKAYDPDFARELQENANSLKERVVNRAQSLQRQLNRPAPNRRAFQGDLSRFAQWRAANDAGGAKLEQVRFQDKPALWIRATGPTTSSWRTRVELAEGRYAFEGMARSAGLEPVRDEKGAGAGLRISGSQQPRRNQLAGDSPWQKLVYEFEVLNSSEEIELVCELRATQGEVWFDFESLRLVQLK